VLPLRERAGVRGVRWYVRSRASEYRPYLAFARHKYDGSVIGPETEMVIDGFPRCASTFATMAFQTAQPRPVRLAHHLHAPAQLIEAARRGIPSIATVRRPRDAVISCVIREPYIPLGWGLDAYARFYEALAPFVSEIVVAPFEDVTRDFPAVVELVNNRFGKQMATGAHDQERVAQCFHLIDLRARGGGLARVINRYMSGMIDADQLAEGLAGYEHEAGAAVPEHRVARPSQQRADEWQALAEEYQTPGHAKVRARAERAFERLVRAPALAS
jgi:hypothetical protein